MTVYASVNSQAMPTVVLQLMLHKLQLLLYALHLPLHRLQVLSHTLWLPLRMLQLPSHLLQVAWKLTHGMSKSIPCKSAHIPCGRKRGAASAFGTQHHHHHLVSGFMQKVQRARGAHVCSNL